MLQDHPDKVQVATGSPEPKLKPLSLVLPLHPHPNIYPNPNPNPNPYPNPYPRPPSADEYLYVEGSSSRVGDVDCLAAGFKSGQGWG